MGIDLQAALVAEPDNPEATALLHKRSVNVEKVRAVLFKYHTLPSTCNTAVGTQTNHQRAILRGDLARDRVITTAKRS